jgi:ABC-type Fe3+-hydroxamate transport system substrate-binding protein
MPEAMSVRGGLWPMAGKLKMVSQILGCPNCVTMKKKDAIPNALKKRGIKRVILSKGNNPYCLYKKKIKPENVAPLLDGLDVDIQYVDFSQGLESAIKQTADLFGVPEKADGLIKSYKGDLAMAKRMLPAEPLGKKVVIISGTYQAANGKRMLRVEAPGGYADKFILEHLGCANAGEAFNTKGEKPDKGHYMVRKTKNGFDLSPLIAADPDVIIGTGDCFAVQKAIAAYAVKHPEIKNIKAVKNMAVYALPGYIDSGVIEYPSVLRKWAVALAH